MEDYMKLSDIIYVLSVTAIVGCIVVVGWTLLGDIEYSDNLLMYIGGALILVITAMPYLMMAMLDATKSGEKIKNIRAIAPSHSILKNYNYFYSGAEDIKRQLEQEIK